MQIIKNNWTYVAGALLGAIGGYFYWKYIGCASGTCPITSSATISTIYGSLMGGLAGGIFKRKKVNNNTDNNPNIKSSSK